MSDEWGVDQVDLDAYARRVGCHGPFEATVDTLRRLHRAHVGAISFENLDVLLGRPVPLDLPSLQDKLVRRPRGGYCHEQNLLFAAVLERIGLRVRRLLARPRGHGPTLARGHCTLVVEAEGGTWLADVGYGGRGPVEPLPLAAGTTVHRGGWAHRLERDRGEWVLAAGDSGKWTDLYAVTPFPYRRPDFEMAHYFTSTHPSSPFTRDLVVQRTTASTRYARHDLEFTLERPGQPPRRRRLAADDLATVLGDVFGIGLTDGEAGSLAELVRRS
jgi:N-hydroxyarylamine O-acetyltransferase